MLPLSLRQNMLDQMGNSSKVQCAGIDPYRTCWQVPANWSSSPCMPVHRALSQAQLQPRELSQQPVKASTFLFSHLESPHCFWKHKTPFSGMLKHSVLRYCSLHFPVSNFCLLYVGVKSNRVCSCSCWIWDQVGIHHLKPCGNTCFRAGLFWIVALETKNSWTKSIIACSLCKSCTGFRSRTVLFLKH